MRDHTGMNAIVIVFVPIPSGLPTEETIGSGRINLFPGAVDLDNIEASVRKNSNRSDDAAPLWTWFIKNPRSCGV